MRPNEYCPMGSPSLLNGDFFENLARLIDFSWSTLLSSDPSPTNTTVRGDTTNVTTTPTTSTLKNENSFFALPIYLQLISILSPTVYAFTTVAIIMQLSRCFKITRNRLVGAGGFVLFWYIVFSVLMVTGRMLPGVVGLLIPALVIVAVFHMMTFGTALLFIAVKNLWPTQTEGGYFKHRYEIKTFSILALLLFLFAPVDRPNVCPDLAKRQFSEFLFFTSFMFLWMGVLGVSVFHNYCSAEELNILKDKKCTGKLKMKEGLGWIEYAYGNIETA